MAVLRNPPDIYLGELFNIQRVPLIGFENKNYIKRVI